MFRYLKRSCALIAALIVAGHAAWAFDTNATAAWVYDVTTHTVLLDKNGSLAVPPASMSKLMTLNMLLESLQDGRVTPQTTFAVSARAKAMKGSTMFLNEMDRPTVAELLRGIIVNSGNDASVVVAEGLAGSEDEFAAQMTARAADLGMVSSHFANASGWPDPAQRMSMKDLGLLATRLIEEFPEYYPIFSETEFNYKDRAPDNRFNRNPLLKLGIGGDGLKTGHTEEAGYGIVGSVKQGDRRIVFAITGLTSETERSEESERIAAWAFREFSLKTVVKSGVRLAEAKIFMGQTESVGLVSSEDLQLLIPFLVQDGLDAEVVLVEPLLAPIAKGQQVAELVIKVPGMPSATIPLVAETDVPKGGFMTRMSVAIQRLIARLSGAAAG